MATPNRAQGIPESAKGGCCKRNIRPQARYQTWSPSKNHKAHHANI